MRQPNIIPFPARYQPVEGAFNLSDDTAISFLPDGIEIYRLALFLADGIIQLTGYECGLINSEDNNRPHNIITIRLSGGEFSNDESYEIEVTPKSSIIQAATETGLFYGIQTFLQMIPLVPRMANSISIPCLEIEDTPRFQWRGMHLDVSRHYFSVDEIKKYIDLLAMHKMNIFHWHLTDDQGWRIEIKAYPRLTEIGAWRKDEKGNRYGGYYSQEDIQEIILYAARRCITIVPEIDMPGHTMAMLAAYPELSCGGEYFDVPDRWGIFDDVLCIGNSKTYEFVENIFDEICELFPGLYIHMGGDECPTVRWNNHSLCKDKMISSGLSDIADWQGYFTQHVASYLKSKGKIPIGWDEVTGKQSINNMSIMCWRGMDKTIDAVGKGFDVVMSPTSHCYFDYYQAVENEPKAIGGLLPIEKVYSFNPIPKGLSERERSHILGGQGNVWTEYMPDYKHVEYMAVPRICALAETLWTPEPNRNYNDFLKRLRIHLERLKLKGINYRELD